ncbi:protein sorting system archaetidylserine decarboxylase [Halodesulfurarchaeum sp. HSR-GB]|uniref:protein sorting system archaetidylserine decarboxylase n=1 Tax=Halodesulfurarchaeum sp. HSR-GB TaxID=3074077 RepID=UPI002855A890|nr:protein sorting system archaetidylserine decarboxylase [Halodesulfurarchaeum sp. HSR-GB]MDR5656221.1 protein sorting system archaetidylserine decarboxylase [Halodesulfurarchaeum sp. HSR-GB]
MDLAPGTWRLAAPLLALGGLGLLFAPIWGLLGLILGGFVVWFHRDPDRDPPDSGLLSPADGTVTVLRTEDDRVRVGVFMNVTDVHVNRSPIAGEITSVEHVPGGHWPAFSKEAERNERLHVDYEDLRVTLIAGTVARRIHPHVEPGTVVSRGERISHVSFGSRADVLLPPRFEMADVTVETGETVRAGESVLADDPRH